jgi:hypothetical protein
MPANKEEKFLLNPFFSLPRNRKWWKKPIELHWALPFSNGIETLFMSLPE